MPVVEICGKCFIIGSQVAILYRLGDTLYVEQGKLKSMERIGTRIINIDTNSTCNARIACKTIVDMFEIRKGDEPLPDLCDAQQAWLLFVSRRMRTMESQIRDLVEWKQSLSEPA